MGFVPGAMEEYRPWLEEGFRRAGNGKGFHNFGIQASVHVEVGNDVKASLQKLKPEVALYVGGMGHKTKNFHNDIMVRRGFGDAAKRIQELYLAHRKDEAIAATTKLRLGTGVALVPQRNPIYTAKEMCTLDWLSDGRIDFGIGVGWNKEEVEACGYRWEDRGKRCDEFLEVMRRLWTEPVVDFSGKWVKFETMRMDPKPIQKPHVPIIVGGYADAAFARAVKFGAGWYGFNLDPTRAKQMLDKLDAAFAKAGRKRDAKYEIIITPPMNMAPDHVKEYAALGVHRLIVNLGSQRPEKVDQ